MAVTYVRAQPEWHVRFDEYEKRDVLFLEPSLEYSLRDVGETFRNLDPALTIPESMIIRGSDIDLIERIRNDTIISRFKTKKNIAALVGGFDKDNRQPKIHQVFDKFNQDLFPNLDEFREIEIRAIVQRSGAIYHGDTHHFVLPSGTHAEKFIRIGDAFQDIVSVRRFADWLLPHLHPYTILVADTGSMLALLLAVRDEARSRFGWHTEIVTLNHYPLDFRGVDNAVRTAKNFPAFKTISNERHDRQILFILSVNSTGKVLHLFNSFGGQANNILVVCDASPAPKKLHYNALANSPVEKWTPNDEGDCEKCKDTIPVHIHPETYERLPNLVWDDIKLSKSYAEEQRKFWELADIAEAVQLHIDKPYSGGTRHFAVYLDIPKLLEQEEFKNSCINTLQELGKPCVAIVPQHTQSKSVISLLQSAFGKTKILSVDSGRISKNEWEGIKGVNSILVADDSIITGSTFLNLRAHLYQITQSHCEDPVVSAFAVVARPTDEQLLRTIGNRYANKEKVNGLSFGAKVLLPNGSRCSWCEEYEMLRTFSKSISESSMKALERRIKHLTGEINPPLLLIDKQELAFDRKTHGSFFGELRPATAFAAGSSAVQRISKQFGSQSSKPKFTVLDTAMAISSYYEGILLAAILRSVAPVYLRNPKKDAAVSAGINLINPSTAYPGVIAELMLAAITGKVPAEPVRNLMNKSGKSNCWIDMLQEILDCVFPLPQNT